MVPTRQGGHQAAGLCVAICFGVGGGIIVGKEQEQPLQPPFGLTIKLKIYSMYVNNRASAVFE